MTIATCRAPDSFMDVVVTPDADSVTLEETGIRWRGQDDTVPETVIPSTWQGSPSYHAVYLYRADSGELGMIHHNGDEDVASLLPAGSELLTRICSWALRTDTDTPETVEIHRVVIVDEPPQEGTP